VMQQVVGTGQPKPPQGGMFGMGGPPPEKGDIRALWNLLEIQVTGDQGELRNIPGEVVWQKYNPYPRFQGRGLGDELVFIRNDMPDNRDPFNYEAPVVANFEEVLFPYPTGLSQKLGASSKMIELVRTSEDRSGTIEVNKLQATNLDPDALQFERGKPTKRSYILAAWIQGEKSAAAEGESSGQSKTVEIKPTAASGDQASDSGKKGVNAIYVGDIDVLSSEFVRMRNEPNLMIARFRFDNVPFVCNLIDAVAGENRFLEIRKRKPKHSTLRMVEIRAASARQKQQEEIAKTRSTFTDEEKKAETEAQKVYAELEKLVKDLQERQNRGEQIDPAELEAKMAQLQIKKSFIDRQLTVTKQRLQRDRDQALAAIEREQDQDIQRIQNEYKIQATVFPPILPLLVGIVVWTRRRIREREGISRSRMRT
jgi:ABC-2 type transport system permease protein